MWLDVLTLLGVGAVTLGFSRLLRRVEQATKPGLTEADVRLLQWPSGNVTVLSSNGHHAGRKIERVS